MNDDAMTTRRQFIVGSAALLFGRPAHAEAPIVTEDGLYKELAADGATLSRVGDCVAPRRVMHAILEGGRAGREA